MERGSKKPAGKGKRKIEIRRIESEDARQVCFSKRRQGLVKKAIDLAILTGAEVAVIGISPANNPFGFGSPSAVSVMSRALHIDDNNNANANANANDVVMEELLDNAVVEGLRRECEEVQKKVEAEKARQKAVSEAVKRGLGEREFWWEADVDVLGMEELKEFQEALLRMKNNVEHRADALLRLGQQSSSSSH